MVDKLTWSPLSPFKPSVPGYPLSPFGPGKPSLPGSPGDPWGPGTPVAPWGPWKISFYNITAEIVVWIISWNYTRFPFSAKHFGVQLDEFPRWS